MALTLPAAAQDTTAGDDAAALPLIPLPAPPAPADAPVLETVVVTGTRTEHTLADSPVDVQVVTRETIRNSGARDLAELLEREGGVYVSRSAGRGSTIEIQGLSGEEVLILVDGRRMIGRVNGAIDLTRLRVDSIDHVEIVKGPSSALYGADAMGGVVNVITRRGGETDGSITLRGDQRHDYDAYGDAGFRLGSAIDGRVSGGYLRTQSYDLDKSTAAEDGADGKSRFWTADGDWHLGDAGDIGAYAAYSLDDTLRVDGGTSAAQLFDTQKRIEEVRTGIAPRFNLGRDTQLSIDAYYNRYDDQFLQQQRGNSANTIDEETLDQLYVGGAQLDHLIGAHRISVGSEYQFEQLESDRLEQTGERDREAVYAQDEWRWQALTIVPGLRYDRDSQFGSQWSPKLALRYDVNEAWLMRAGYGRGYRAPDFKELLLRFENPAVGYRVDGNPALQPERSTGYNLGLVWTPDARANVSLSAYHNDVDQLIEIVQTEIGPPIVFSYRNVASAKLTGLDLQARLRPFEPLEVQLGYGYLHSRDEETGGTLSGRPENRANAAVRYEAGAYALQLRGVWIGEREFSVDLDSGGAPTAAGKADAYTLLDLRAEWAPWHWLRLAAGVDNLLDKGDPQYLPIMPRTAYLETRWSWK